MNQFEGVVTASGSGSDVCGFKPWQSESLGIQIIKLSATCELDLRLFASKTQKRPGLSLDVKQQYEQEWKNFCWEKLGGMEDK